MAVGWVAPFVDEFPDGFAGCGGTDLASDEFGSLADPIAPVDCPPPYSRRSDRTGPTRCPPSIASLASLSGYSAFVSLVRFIDILLLFPLLFFLSRYGARVSVVSEQTFRVAGPALPIDVVHEPGHVSVGWCVFNEFWFSFQDGFELEHA